MKGHNDGPTRALAVALLALVLGAAALSLATFASPALARTAQQNAVGTVVAAPEFSICQQGATQLLMEGDELLFQLKSDSVDLAAYQGYRVRVRGEALAPIEGCAPLLVVRGVRVLGPSGAYPGYP